MRHNSSPLLICACLAFAACSGEVAPKSSLVAEISSGHVVSHLADPSVVYSAYLQKYILSGTGTAMDLPFYLSVDGLNFDWALSISPSEADPDYDYCKIWAPDLFIPGDDQRTLQVTFSASRYDQGAECKIDASVTTFKMSVSLDSGRAARPETIGNPAAGGPASSMEPGCIGGVIPNGWTCERTIRIDSDNFLDPATGRTHFYYTWFGHDPISHNNVSSFVLDDPERIQRNILSSETQDEHILEAPDVFERNGKYYLVYSRGNFANSYSLGYLMGDSPSMLSTSHVPRRSLREPIFGQATGCTGYSGRSILDAGGHSSTIRIGEDYFIFFHINESVYGPDGCHQVTRRHTVRQKLTFLPDNRILNLRGVFLRWDELGPGYEYSLDVQTPTRTFAPCIGADKIGSSTWVEFDGRCGSDELGEAANLSFRVCAAQNGNWSSALCSPYVSATSTTLDLDLPRPRGLMFRWNNLGDGYEYSLDLEARDGRLFLPCVDAGQLRDSLSHWFEGTCPGRGALAPDQVGRARVCAARDGQWQDAVCSPAQAVTETGLVMHLPLAEISFSWNALGPGYLYSLDLQTRSGQTIAPCVHAGILGGQTSHRFSGECPGRGEVPPAEVTSARICAAADHDWSHAICSPYTRTEASTRLTLSR